MKKLAAVFSVLAVFFIGGKCAAQNGTADSSREINTCVFELPKILASGASKNDEQVKVGQREINQSDSKLKRPVKVNPISFVFDGLTAFTDCDALKLMRESSNLRSDRMPNDESALKAAAELKHALESKGYFNARVDVITKADARTIQFIINEGPRYRIAAIRFLGNQFLSSVELLNYLDDCLGRGDSQAYDSDMFDYCERRTTNLIRSRGYLQASIRTDQQITNQGLVITCTVNEGPIYRLGEVKIIGSSFTADELRARLKLHQGNIVDGNKIAEWLFEDLKKFYGDRGFIQYTAEPVPTFKNGVVDFEVIIDEGKRFTLQSIVFTYDEPMIDPHELLGMREGDYYNQTLFEGGIKRLNDLGIFEFVDQDRDIALKTSEEDATVKLEITLHKKKL